MSGKPGKSGKVRESKSGQGKSGKVREFSNGSGKICQMLKILSRALEFSSNICRALTNFLLKLCRDKEFSSQSWSRQEFFGQGKL